MNLRMFFSSYDAGVLDKSVMDVIDALRQHSIPVIGPIPLPTGFSSFKPYEGNVTHRRMIDIESPKKGILEILADVNIPIGVDVKMKYTDDIP